LPPALLKSLRTQELRRRRFGNTPDRSGETGLDYFGARYFSSAQGRWTSPDWSPTPQAVPYARLTDPQTLNLYSYVRNNPLNTVDRDGHFFRELWNWANGNGWRKGEAVDSTVSYPEQPITNPAFYAVAQGMNQAAPVVNTLAVATAAVPAVAFGAAALAGASAATVATAGTAGTAGVAAAESPQGQQAIAGLLPAAQNGVQWAGEITTSVTQSATTMFRVWGGASQQAGAWLTPNMPASPSAAISSLSLPLGNTAQFVSQGRYRLAH
jgi:RHS repeat-associated protein